MTTHLHDLIDLEALDAHIATGNVRRQVDPTGTLAILNYTDQAVYTKAWDDVTAQSRGLIYRLADGVIVARPWRKFWNYGEHAADTLDLEAAVEVTDKEDGSLGILYTARDGRPAIATRGSFTSEQALHATALYRERYEGEWNPQPGRTYLFEIVYPANRIVRDYGDLDELILLGDVLIETGGTTGPYASAIADDWPGPVAQMFDYVTLADALAAEPRPGAEGLVVRYLNGEHKGTMVKIKQEDYVRLHALATKTSTLTVWETLMAGHRVLDDAPNMPDEFLAWVEKCEAALQSAHAEYVDTAHAEFERVQAEVGADADRKTFALAAVSSPYRSAMFRLLDGRNIDDMAWKAIRPEWEPARMISEDVA